jgi:CRP/FNR family transcriptional regulator
MKLDICKICNKRSLAAEHLGSEELERLGYSCVEVTFSKGDIIFKQDALSSNIIYIKEGLVSIHLTGPEREQILKIAKGPSYLGIPTTLGDKINHYSATALTDTKVCFIDIGTFKNFIATNNDFAYEVIIELCKNELNHFHRCVNQLQKQSPGRVAEALLFFSQDIYESDGFTIPLNRHELGDLTGCSRENISRILANFHKDGLIEIDGRDVKILKKDVLKMISRNG